jgi:hypothetical protein
MVESICGQDFAYERRLSKRTSQTRTKKSYKKAPATAEQISVQKSSQTGAP